MIWQFFKNLFSSKKLESAASSPQSGKTSRSKEAPSFHSFQFDERIKMGLDDMGFKIPTPIQVQAIPLVLQGKDVIGLAQTGTGKTAAFLLPILQRVLEMESSHTEALILTPTRELAQQIEEQILGLAYHTQIRSVSIVGGVPYEGQESALVAKVPMIVATPGRLMDHMKSKVADLSHVKFLVIDEADKMHDMGFLPDIHFILSALPKQRQTMLFSATMPDPIKKLAEKNLNQPVQIKAGSTNQAAPSVTQTVLLVDERNKTPLLLKMLRNPDFSMVLVFVNTKKGTHYLTSYLQRSGIRTECIHGGRTQEERTEALNRFKADHIQCLVATDIAARGIDITGITQVINYDIPQSSEEYIHRVGRTGRASFKGEAFTLVTGGEMEIWEKLSRDLKANVSIERTSYFSGEVKERHSSSEKHRHQSHRGRRNKRHSNHH